MPWPALIIEKLGARKPFRRGNIEEIGQDDAKLLGILVRTGEPGQLRVGQFFLKGIDELQINKKA